MKIQSEKMVIIAQKNYKLIPGPIKPIKNRRKISLIFLSIDSEETRCIKIIFISGSLLGLFRQYQNTESAFIGIYNKIHDKIREIKTINYNQLYSDKIRRTNMRIFEDLKKYRNNDVFFIDKNFKMPRFEKFFRSEKINFFENAIFCCLDEPIKQKKVKGSGIAVVIFGLRIYENLFDILD